MLYKSVKMHSHLPQGEGEIHAEPSYLSRQPMKTSLYLGQIGGLTLTQ